MISAQLAADLRSAGLAWQPQEHDHFAIPGDEFAGQVFSLNQFPALLELVHGRLAITFHGSSEWALDYLLMSEAVWLPSETQLRERIAQLLGLDAELALARTARGYRCQAEGYSAQAEDAESAYALVLLQILRDRAG